MTRLAAALLLALAACGSTGSTSVAPATSGASGRRAAESYRNPVFDHDAPDPSVVLAGDGAYYVVTTQSDYDGRFVHVPVLRSTDLVHWHLVGDALPRYPSWVHEDTWAPQIVRLGSRYLLYYTGRRVDSGQLGIGVATARSPAGPFTDAGGPLLETDDEVLDPAVLQAHDTRLYLYWAHENTIVGQPLTADGLAVDGAPHLLLRPHGRGFESVVEGPWVVEHGAWYYLLTSGDNCCGAHARYAVSAARSRFPLGPFARRAGGPFLRPNATFAAPGHNSTIRDAADQDWIVYHAIVRSRLPDEAPVLMLDWLRFDHGWPVVPGGPSSSAQPAPAAR